jgi:aminoglycoside/choline kinase family phosphotransferase
MADTGCNLQLGDYLKKIEEILITEVPSYLEFTGGTLIKDHSENDRITYNILDCSVKLVDPLQLGFHAASDMYEAEIHLKDNNSKNVHIVLVKTMPSNAIVRTIQNSADQFFNESKVFSEIVPLLLQTCSKSSCRDIKAERLSCNLSAVYDLFPKCYYVSPDPENGMIVLQDLRTLGYKIGGDKTMLMDYDHIVLALEGLARYHALSYGTKKKDFERYKHVVTQIRDARRFVRKQAVSNSVTVGYSMFLRHTTMLVLDKFNEIQLEEGGLYTDKIRRVREKIDNCTELLRELLAPEEPLSVLCHGDFNRNNMLFRYDSNCRPTGVKFLDFQNPFYASPAIDLSFFLFVNASPKLWANCWDGLFSIYHQTLLDALSEFLNCPQEELLPEFSHEAFKNQFSKYSLYGFLLATSFIIANADDSNDVKAFGMYSNGIPSLQEMDIYMKENVKFVEVEVTDRVLQLTQELLDQISL